MKQYSKKNIINTLKKIGIKKGSVVLIHSAFHTLGTMKSIAINNIPKEIYYTIKKYLGSKGTIVVPAFFYDYSRKKKTFDLYKSPPDISLGIFSKYIFNNQKFLRSKNPITSLAATGYLAKKICGKSNSRPYGKGSAWEELTNSNSYILFFGTTLANSLTYIHYIEFLAGVPHMYLKKFNIPIKEKGKIIEKEGLAYVRYLDFNIEVDLKKFEKDLKNKGLLKSKKLGSGFVSSVKCKDILNFGLKKIIKNSFYFLKQNPSFRKNSYPLK